MAGGIHFHNLKLPHLWAQHVTGAGLWASWKEYGRKRARECRAAHDATIFPALHPAPFSDEQKRKESLVINSQCNIPYVNNILDILWIKENVLNRCIIHSTVAVLTSCDQMTSTGNEAWCVPKPASRGNSSANLAGLDFSPKSSELTLQWKQPQSEKFNIRSTFSYFH